jgi:hypothetical protein
VNATATARWAHIFHQLVNLQHLIRLDKQHFVGRAKQ